MPIYHVFELYDPRDDSVFHVGRTKQPIRTTLGWVQRHARAAGLGDRVRAIVDAGSEPRVRVVERCRDGRRAAVICRQRTRELVGQSPRVRAWPQLEEERPPLEAWCGLASDYTVRCAYLPRHCVPGFDTPRGQA